MIYVVVIVVVPGLPLALAAVAVPTEQRAERKDLTKVSALQEVVHGPPAEAKVQTQIYKYGTSIYMHQRVLAGGAHGMVTPCSVRGLCVQELRCFSLGPPMTPNTSLRDSHVPGRACDASGGGCDPIDDWGGTGGEGGDGLGGYGGVMRGGEDLGGYGGGGG